MDQNRLIGKNNNLPWRLPADLKRFKSITLGKPVIMGRKTYESIGKPLPGRRNIIISRRTGYSAEGCEIVSGLDIAIGIASKDAEVMIIGGGSIYQQALPVANRMYLTVIAHAFDGDAWFPAYNESDWKVVDSEAHMHENEQVAFEYRFLTLERR